MSSPAGQVLNAMRQRQAACRLIEGRKGRRRCAKERNPTKRGPFEAPTTTIGRTQLEAFRACAFHVLSVLCNTPQGPGERGVCVKAEKLSEGRRSARSTDPTVAYCRMLLHSTPSPLPISLVEMMCQSLIASLQITWPSTDWLRLSICTIGVNRSCVLSFAFPPRAVALRAASSLMVRCVKRELAC